MAVGEGSGGVYGCNCAAVLWNGMHVECSCVVCCVYRLHGCMVSCACD